LVPDDVDLAGDQRVGCGGWIDDRLAIRPVDLGQACRGIIEAVFGARLVSGVNEVDDSFSPGLSIRPS
jgi:hypothetical protein